VVGGRGAGYPTLLPTVQILGSLILGKIRDLTLLFFVPAKIMKEREISC